MKRYDLAMAAWQFVLDLVPTPAAQVAGVTAARMSREQLDNKPIEVSSVDAELLFAQLGALLPEKRSWSANLRIWGDEKLDDIQISLVEGQTIEDVQFRLDVRALSLPLIEGICAVARYFECVLATRDGAIVQPHREAVVRMVMHSRAMQFVRDPQRFLEEAIRLDRDGV